MAESNGWLPANPNPNPTHNPNKDTNMSLLSSDSYTVNITDAKAPAAKAWALANLTTHAEVAHAMHAEAMRVKPRKSVNSALDAIAQRFQAEDAALAKAEDSAATDGDTSAPAAPKVVAAVAAVVAPPAPPVTRTLADCKAYAASVQTTEDHCTDAENLRALATLAAMVLAIPDAPVKAAKARSPRKARTAAVKPYPQPRTDTLADVAAGEWFTRNGTPTSSCRWPTAAPASPCWSRTGWPSANGPGPAVTRTCPAARWPLPALTRPTLRRGTSWPPRRLLSRGETGPLRGPCPAGRASRG